MCMSSVWLGTCQCPRLPISILWCPSRVTSRPGQASQVTVVTVASGLQGANPGSHFPPLVLTWYLKSDWCCVLPQDGINFSRQYSSTVIPVPWIQTPSSANSLSEAHCNAEWKGRTTSGTPQHRSGQTSSHASVQVPKRTDVEAEAHPPISRDLTLADYASVVPSGDPNQMAQASSHPLTMIALPQTPVPASTQLPASRPCKWPTALTLTLTAMVTVKASSSPVTQALALEQH
ncbi:hypothetical protein FZEAL_8995 [Fusarium zealandicum]|uniref:Uncharacterized protein n=1 Tax=Fusarium zealandicum TaxID=1053134 RepID=A0A8H4XGY6_9HYPO|nr:hypothetical protein FZEAL_8995 [Fusarium zealandicum]